MKTCTKCHSELDQLTVGRDAFVNILTASLAETENDHD
jgi:hypothetical protein